MSSIRGLSAQDDEGVLEEIARIDESVMREEITQLRDEATEKRVPMVQADNFDPYYKWLGIPPEEQPPNHYRLLGVCLYETDIEVIESAADQRMTYVQQLATGPYSDLSQTLLNELAAARVCLLNSDSKSEYNISLRKLLAKVRKRAQKKQQDREADEFEELEPVLPEPTGQRRRPGSRKQGQRRRSNWKQFPWMVIGVAAVAVGFASWGTYRLLNSDGSAVTVAKDDTTTLVPEVAAGTGTSSKEAKGEKAAPSPTKKDMGTTEPSAKPGRPPLAIAPFQATPAVVAVERMVPVAFTIKSDPTLIPEHLRGASTWVFAAKVATGEKNAVLRFNVLQSGKVYLIAHWQYEGNTRGNWHKERLTKKQLIAQGWQDLGPCAWDQESFLFKKTVKQGEVFSIRTNKYWPPKLVTRSVSPAIAIAPFDATTAKQHQQAWADQLGTPVETTNSIGMKLKLIPAGEFQMGSSDSGSDALDREKPQHLVQITKPFYLGVYEITQQQYEKVMGKNPTRFKGAKNPVDSMTWIEAVEFCRRLSELPEEKAAGHVYRLPTEAEWEYSCRTGTTTKYSLGDSDSQLGEYAWFEKNSGDTTHPVGQKKVNPWGLCDMHGNVWEWCQDWYGREVLKTDCY